MSEGVGARTACRETFEGISGAGRSGKRVGSSAVTRDGWSATNERRGERCSRQREREIHDAVGEKRFKKDEGAFSRTAAHMRRAW